MLSLVITMLAPRHTLLRYMIRHYIRCCCHYAAISGHYAIRRYYIASLPVADYAIVICFITTLFCAAMFFFFVFR